YRTALMNKKYYGARLRHYRRINRWFELMIALGATTGTGIGGLVIWKQAYWGTVTWAIISGLSVCLTTIKPVLDYGKEIERNSKLAGEYAALFETFRIMEQDIRVAQQLTSDQVETFNQIRRRSIELAQLDDVHPDRRILQLACDEVKREIPAESLWMPT